MEDKYSLSVARVLEHCKVCKRKQGKDYDWCLPMCYKCEPADCTWHVCEECYAAGKIAIEKGGEGPGPPNNLEERLGMSFTSQRSVNHCFY